MRDIGYLPQIEFRKRKTWGDYTIDTLLAIAGVFLVTEIIYALKLTVISNSSLLYLLFILLLAIVRGRYSSIIASILSVLAFDFFFIPPLYTLAISHLRDGLSLVVFLVVALLASQMTAITHRNANLAYQREKEARTLYDFLRLTNSQVDLDDLLETVVITIVRVFPHWGIRACAILLPDEQGNLQVKADAPLHVEDFVVTPDELNAALKAMHLGKLVDQQMLGENNAAEQFSRLVPLKADQQVIGVLCLRVQNPPFWFANEASMEEEMQQLHNKMNFFWTFVEQSAHVIKHTKRRSTNIGDTQ